MRLSLHPTPTRIRAYGRRGHNAARRSLLQCRASTATDELRLQQLLRWLTANGAKGFGDPDDPNTKVGVFLQDTNNRGLIATKDVKAGQVIFQVPVALGVVHAAQGDECPWSVRLAAKVLRLKAEGDACLWSEYINVLPDRVSNPTSPDVAFEQVVAIGDEVARSEVDFSRWIASSNFKRLLEGGPGLPELPEGTTEEAFCDAMAVVHSRTFSIPAKDRPSGLARLLMPGIDLLNHAGDVDLAMCDASRSDLEVLATDACRWDLVPKIGGQLVMVVSAVRDIVRGEEVTLSYGERSNDDFFVHYGFVPPRNPHDTVQLHEDVRSAVAWSIERIHATGTAAPDEGLVQLYETLCATHADDGGVSTDHMEFVDSERTSKLKKRVNVQSRGRVDERLAIVLEKIHAYVSQYDDVGTKEEFIRDHVSQRAFEVLASMPADFLDDLATLQAAMQDDELHDFATMRRTYTDRVTKSPWWLRLQERRAQLRAHAEEEGAPEATENTSIERPDDVDGLSLATVQFRAYKSLILWDCLVV